MDKEIRLSQGASMTLLLGEVISDLKKIDSHGNMMVTFMIETKKDNHSEKHKIVCFDGLAKKVVSDLKIGMTVFVTGVNRSKPIKSVNESGEESKIVSRDVVAKKVAIANGVTDNHINRVMLFGKVVSDIRHSDSHIGPVSTFVFQTEEIFYSERHKETKKTKEIHKILCFDDVAQMTKDNGIAKGDIIFIDGENHSKLINNNEDKYIVRDVKANTISKVK